MAAFSNLKSDFNHLESLYWVFTQLCNDQCDHCYNLSGPQGEQITTEECLLIVDHLPDAIDRIILSGGEPLTERAKLYAILDKLKARYQNRSQIMLQTNGDLLTGPILDRLIESGVTRIDIASIDRFHKHKGERIENLKTLFKSRGMTDDETEPLINKATYLKKESISFGFWGANDDMWLGGNWPRGRAMEKNIWKKDPSHNFCSILSGGRNFLGGFEDIPQEISIQLWKINPCCPGTKYPMGDARKEKVSDVLKRAAISPVMQKINDGNPLEMGVSLGITQEYAQNRTEKLQNMCLWCDEFLEKHFDIQTLKPKVNP